MSLLQACSYCLKEKRDKVESTPSKKDPSSSTSVTLSPTLVDPARVSVIRAVDGQDAGLSAQPAEKKKKVEEKKKSVKPKPSTSTAAAVSTAQKFQELDQKWSDRFNRLEALLLAKTLDRPQQEPTFSTVKVVPTHSPPANVIRSEPFINPADQPLTQTADLPATSSDQPAVGAATDPLGSSKKTDRPSTYDKPTSAFQPTRKDTSDSESDSEQSDRPPLDIFVEEGELSEDPDATTNDPEQSLSEQSYRETMRGIRSYMGWTHIPDIKSAAGSSDDNPFAGLRCKPRARFQFIFQQMSGCAEKSQN